MKILETEYFSFYCYFLAFISSGCHKFLISLQMYIYIYTFGICKVGVLKWKGHTLNLFWCIRNGSSIFVSSAECGKKFVFHEFLFVFLCFIFGSLCMKHYSIGEYDHWYHESVKRMYWVNLKKSFMWTFDNQKMVERC